MKSHKSVKTSPAKKQRLGEGNPSEQGPQAITAIEVEGFKSLARRTRVEIRPLTVLAGANSSGKSSAMQGLLLLKQTLDASYDPGPLLLHDSHVKFTSVDQMLSKILGRRSKRTFRFGFEMARHEAEIGISFRRQAEDALEIERMSMRSEGKALTLSPQMSDVELRVPVLDFLGPSAVPSLAKGHERPVLLAVSRDRCFLKLVHSRAGRDSRIGFFFADPTGLAADSLRSILHLPGLRGSRERAYPTTAVGRMFPGTFDIYTASVILSWQKNGDIRLARLDRMAEDLGLTWRVRARQLDATRIEVLVGRLPRKGKDESDLVNLADVGSGVSQVLPVAVALLQARPGQMVYIEQPELHLHPRAQTVMAALLAETAQRGVRVVAETHSALLLLSLQTLVAQGEISPEKVILHWFQRDAEGLTKVTSGELDRQGAYGDWPEDFGEVEAKAEGQYLDTVEELLGVR